MFISRTHSIIPAPGDQITPDHYLNVVRKIGQANAYSFSIFSPAAVIFKAKDTTIQDFVLKEGSIIQNQEALRIR